MREQVIQVVEQYIDAVRHNDASALPLHPDAVCEFPTNTYRGEASFRKGLDDFARIMKSIEVIRLVVDGEHCVAILNIDTVFGITSAQLFLALFPLRRACRDTSPVVR